MSVNIEDRKRIWINMAGDKHRTDGPAIEMADGRNMWYVDGNRHRTDGPAIELADGHKEWYINGQLHRTDGPAVEFADGGNTWYINGKRHRTDGPAVECVNGVKWWMSDRNVSKNEVVNHIVQRELLNRLLTRVVHHGCETLVDKFQV